MDCVEGALRNSFVPETPLKMTQNQTFGDDLSAAGAGQNGVSGDDFFVDDLLDFSNGFVEGEGEEEEGKNQGGEDISDKVTISVKEDFASLPVSEISVPTDDLDSLEWLSHFVEDSFSGYSLAYPAGKLPVEKKTGDGEIPVEEKKPCFATPVQTKARTKRGRTSVRVWPACSGSLTDSSSSSTSSSSTTTMSSSPTASWFLYPNSGSLCRVTR
ncbi:hypothetical protein KY290_015017 [Solanum tuberosum]|uniref:GATA transcription factor n=1 Tax=Solanum tuberosum TaxID=4113 RepID=A0ABQ7VRA2_SOLTU|nr:hypothetical protein KY290_015017 [Solanum tuberosum]